jgi:UDP-N-acetylglucosamine--N-acetylmuramyl-(pentapeptide) pyrophosphoryl-undecaprenol N-acetylglucosamine transferase
MMLNQPITQLSAGTLMVMAGGTGGHVYPAMAVADYLHALGWRIVWLATENGMENRLIEGKGYTKSMITMRGVRGKGLLGWLLLPFKLAIAFKQSFSAIRKYQPSVVLGMGGFAAFPGGLMARLLQKPLVIHEQNSIAGLTNKALSHCTNHVLSGFPLSAKNGYIAQTAKHVGNPVRQEITQLSQPEIRYLARTGKLKVLVLGGSLGAAALNDVIPKALGVMPIESRPEVLHQAGEKHIANLQAHYEKLNVAATTKAFIGDMAEAYAWADLVICRAGALTIAELACAGVASVLVPFPHAVDNHQTFNARYLSDAGAAKLVQQKDLTMQVIQDILNTMTREVCLQMAIAAKRLAKPEATQTVAHYCVELAV